MITLLEKLVETLEDAFKSNLKASELKFRRDERLDVFKTYMTLAKTANDFRRLIEKSTLPISDLKENFGGKVDDALKSKFISRGVTINDDKVFINSKGIYNYYLEKNLNIQDVFEAFDNYKFPTQELIIKRQEKILALFLLLMGADSEQNRLITKNNDKDTLRRYHEFLIKIDDEIKKSGLTIGREFDWNVGKKVAFRSFIQENNNLPKTGIYDFKTSDISYWLNLEKKRNVSYFVNLVLDEYIDPTDKWMAKEKLNDVLINLSNIMPEILLEVPKDLNKRFIQELRN